MSISKTFKKLFDSKKISSARPEADHPGEASPRARRRTGAKPTVHIKSSRQTVYPLAPDDPLVANITKSIKVVFKEKEEVREIEARIPVKNPKLPLYKVESKGQKRKLGLQFASLPAEERKELIEFLQLVEQEDEETRDQFAEAFRGRISLRQAVGKFARQFVEEKWKEADAECPWPPSFRLDLQLHLLPELDAVRFMLPLKANPALAKQVFSDPAVKTLKEGLEIFNLEKRKASDLTGSPKSKRSDLPEPLAEPQAVPAAEVELQLQSGDESCPLPGLVQTDRPAELSLEALRELASCQDAHKVLCAGPMDDKTTIFAPREAWNASEAKACADYLLWHPIVGRHLIDYSKGNVVTVRGLQLALKQAEAEG